MTKVMAKNAIVALFVLFYVGTVIYALMGVVSVIELDEKWGRVFLAWVALLGVGVMLTLVSNGGSK